MPFCSTHVYTGSAGQVHCPVIENELSHTKVQYRLVYTMSAWTRNADNGLKIRTTCTLLTTWSYSLQNTLLHPTKIGYTDTKIATLFLQDSVHVHNVKNDRLEKKCTINFVSPFEVLWINFWLRHPNCFVNSPQLAALFGTRERKLNQNGFSDLLQLWNRQSSPHDSPDVSKARCARHPGQVHVHVPLARQSSCRVVSSPLVQISHVLRWGHRWKRKQKLLCIQCNFHAKFTDEKNIDIFTSDQNTWRTQNEQCSAPKNCAKWRKTIFWFSWFFSAWGARNGKRMQNEKKKIRTCSNWKLSFWQFCIRRTNCFFFVWSLSCWCHQGLTSPEELLFTQ